MSDLRPTLFLAQLPNLLAGNISLVHGVVGSSRTFMGEEAAGLDAVRVAWARIASGQSELTLVGGAYNGARWDVLLAFELAAAFAAGRIRAIWDRGPAGGVALCTMGAFLVLEGPRARRSPRCRPHETRELFRSLRRRKTETREKSEAALRRQWQALSGEVDREPRGCHFGRLPD